MGGSSWSGQAYNSVQHTRKVTGQSAMTYNDNVIRSTPVHLRKTHDEMDPKQFNNGIRESRDSDVHPNSNAIAVFFDVTGSMENTPRVFQEKLGKLMSMLVEKGYIEHPQVMIGAVGDAYTDRAPIQAGQFESGLEMDSDLGKLYLEAAGGGQMHESYGLVHYLMANHTAIDCWEKRQKKGYLFTIGDEKPWDTIKRDQVESLIGDKLEADIPLKDIIDKVQERYHVYHIIPEHGTYYAGNKEIKEAWRKLLGERVLLLEDTNAISETIALTIGLNEGTIDVVDGLDDLASLGIDAKTIAAAGRAVSTIKTNPNSKAVAIVGNVPTSAAVATVEEL